MYAKKKEHEEKKPDTRPFVCSYLFRFDDHCLLHILSDLLLLY